MTKLNLQPTYSNTNPALVLGGIPNMELGNDISRLVEDAGGLEFARLVVQGTADAQVKKATALAYTSVGAMAGGNTGAATITASPAVAGPAVAGEYELVCVLGGAAAASRWEMRDPDGVFIGVVNGATATTLAGIGPFTIADPGTDPAAGDRATITVTATGGGKVVGVSVRDVTLAPSNTAQDIYPLQATARIRNKGPITVMCGATVAAQDPVFYIPASGKFTNVAGTSNVPVPRAVFDAAGTDANLVVIRMNLS